MPLLEPTGFQIHQHPIPKTPEEMFAEFVLDLRQQMSRMVQQTFDASHPVDEYISGLGQPGSLQAEIQPTYAAFSERIESILIVGLNAAGVTNVQIQLGDRFLPILTGSSMAGIITIAPIGIVLKPHERRIVSATSWGSMNGFFFGLFGHASDVFQTV